MATKKKLFFFIAAIALIISAHGCSSNSQNATQQRINYLIAQGKVQLTNHQYSDAQTTFETVLTQYDKNNNKARFGAAMAVLLHQVDTIVNTLTSLLKQFGFKMFNNGSPVLMPEYTDVGTSGINQIIGGLLYQMLMVNIYKAKGYLDAIISSNDKGFTFQIDSLPLSIGSLYPLGDFGGMYDMEEVYYLDALLNGIDGSMDLLMSVNMDLSFGDIIGYVTATGRFSNVNIDTILEALGFIMVSSPNAFTIEPTDGLINIKSGKTAFATTLQDLINGVDFIMKPPHSEANNVITYGKDNNNKPILTIHIKELGANGYSNSTMNIPLTSSTGGFITDIAARILNNINGGTPYTSFKNDIAPVLSMVVVTMLQSGLVKGIIDQALAGLSPTSQSTLDQLLQFLSVDTLTGLLTSIIPGNVELDLGQYFAHPFSIRSVFPAWVALGQSGTTVTGYTFTAPAAVDATAPIVSTVILEYECHPPSAITTFYCSKSAKFFTSTAHFLGPDGNGITDPDNSNIKIGPLPANPNIPKAYLPYIAFRDPTFGKMLYLQSTTQTTEHNPDLYELNDLIQQVGKNLLGLIQ